MVSRNLFCVMIRSRMSQWCVLFFSSFIWFCRFVMFPVMFWFCIVVFSVFSVLFSMIIRPFRFLIFSFSCIIQLSVV